MPTEIPGLNFLLQLMALLIVTLQTRKLILKHEGAENFNWNYVDQHILGYQEFAELPEVGNTMCLHCNLLCSIIIVFTLSKVSKSLLVVANGANVDMQTRLTAHHRVCQVT